MKKLKYPALTFIGYSPHPLPDAERLKELIKKLLKDWYRSEHRVILCGTRPGFERLVMECATELIESYECQGYNLTLFNCHPKLRTCIGEKRYVHYLDYFISPEDTATLSEFLIASTSLLFLYSNPQTPDPQACALRSSARGTSIPIYNLFEWMEDINLLK